MIRNLSNTHSYNHSRGSVLQDSALALPFALASSTMKDGELKWLQGKAPSSNLVAHVLDLKPLHPYKCAMISLNAEGTIKQVNLKSADPQLNSQILFLNGVYTFVSGVATFCSSTPLGAHDHCHFVGSEQHQH